MNPYRALAVIAAVSVASSVLIVVIALHTLSRISDAGMFGIGLMAFDLSPNFHPAMGRVPASFEPKGLGGATGRGAEPPA